jgi:hypothetical protein
MTTVEVSDYIPPKLVYLHQYSVSVFWGEHDGEDSDNASHATP